MSMEKDGEAILAYLASDEANQGGATSSMIRDYMGLSLARVNTVLDALRRGGEVVEMTVVQDKHGDSIPVWLVTQNRGWAKVWVLRSEWPHPLLPNGREPLPENDPDIPEVFRRNWEAP